MADHFERERLRKQRYESTSHVIRLRKTTWDKWERFKKAKKLKSNDDVACYLLNERFVDATFVQ